MQRVRFNEEIFWTGLQKEMTTEKSLDFELLRIILIFDC